MHGFAVLLVYDLHMGWLVVIDDGGDIGAELQVLVTLVEA